MEYGPTKKIELVDGPRCGEFIDVSWDDTQPGNMLTLGLGPALKKVDPENARTLMLDYSVREGGKAFFLGYVR